MSDIALAAVEVDKGESGGLRVIDTSAELVTDPKGQIRGSRPVVEEATSATGASASVPPPVDAADAAAGGPLGSSGASGAALPASDAAVVPLERVSATRASKSDGMMRGRVSGGLVDEAAAARVSGRVAVPDAAPREADLAVPAGSGRVSAEAVVGPKAPADEALLRSASVSSIASSDPGDSPLMKIVGPGLIDLAAKFPYNDGETDPAKKSAADFIKKLNDYVIKLEEAGAVLGGGGRSRRALKRIMKKYSRRVSRKRGKRVKSSAQ